MPYPNEHAGRIKNPARFKDFRRVKQSDGIDFIFGITSDGKSEIQSIRFNKTKFTETQAKNWMKENNFKPILFEPAMVRENVNMPKHDDKEQEEMARKKEEMEREDRRRREQYAMEDLFTSEEEAEKKAEAMGISGSHTHVHIVDEKEVTFYMPGRSHDEYMKAKEKDNKKDDKEEDMGKHEDEEKMKEDDKEKEMGKHKDDEKDMGAHEDDEEEKEKKNAKVEDCDCEDAKDVCDCKENTAENYSIEQTFNLNGVEIFSTGVWNGDKYGRKDLQAMVDNFDKTGFEPPLKLGHNEEQPEMKDGEPALGYVQKIYVAGNKLLADFKELPKKVYEAIKRGNYKRVSSEIYWNYKNNGSVLDRVLKAVALLGSEIPAVTNLEEITGLYKEVGTGDVKQYFNEKECELMEQDTSKEYKFFTDRIKALEEENEKAHKELEESKAKARDERIQKFITEQKEFGRILPVHEKKVEALLYSATDTKVYSYTKEENTVELSQIELVENLIASLPKLIEFSELSADGEFVVDRQPYDNAGDEVDRRCNLYMEKGKAKTYSEAMELVFKEDEQLEKEYKSQQ